MTDPTIIPYLAAADARAAMAFYGELFGATPVDGELFEMDDGRLGHVTLAIGDARLYLSDEFAEMNVQGPLARGGTTVAIVIRVDDADETMAAAVAAGAVEERAVTNQFGARSGWFVDPWGHRWSPTSDEKPEG